MELYHAATKLRSSVNAAKKRILTLSHRLDKAREKVERYTERSEHADGALYRRTMTQLEMWEKKVHALLQEREGTTEVMKQDEQRLEDIQARRHELRHAPKVRPVVPEPEEKGEQGKEEEQPIRLDPLTFLVRLLSGEIQAVEVDGVQPVSDFAKEFARQNRYHPSAAKRMTFFYPPPEAEEEEKDPLVRMILHVSEKGAQYQVQVEHLAVGPIPFWTPEKYPIGTTFRELYPHGEGIPLLCLFLRPADPSTRGEKIELLRRILIEEGRYNMYSDDDLFTTYDGWYLTHRPAPRENRYQAMKTFVAEYSEKFWFMNPQETEQSVAWNVEWKAVLAFKNAMIIDVQLVSCRHRFSPQFAERRTALRRGILRALGEGEWGLQRLQGNGNAIRCHLTLYELHQLGVPFTLLCSCQKEECHVCHFPSWMERAGPDFIIPAVTEKDHSTDPAVLLAVMIGGAH